MRRDLRSGIAALCRPVTRMLQELRPGLRVLMYHRVARLPGYDQLTVSPQRFEQQMRVLVASRKVVTLEHGLRSLRDGDLQENLVAVTFDDGYLDNLHEAAPILQHYGVPATIFVTTQFCDQTSSHPRYAGATVAARLHLNWGEVVDLADRGFEIGSHTLSHPYLPSLTEERASQEIVQSRIRIEQRLQRPVRYFCYPSGDLSRREVRLVADAGYEAAVSVAPGINRARGDFMQLRRTEVTERDDPDAFALKLDGAFDPVHVLLHARRRRRFARAHRRDSDSDATLESRQ